MFETVCQDITLQRRRQWEIAEIAKGRVERLGNGGTDAAAGLLLERQWPWTKTVQVTHCHLAMAPDTADHWVEGEATKPTECGAQPLAISHEAKSAGIHVQNALEDAGYDIGGVL